MLCYILTVNFEPISHTVFVFAFGVSPGFLPIIESLDLAFDQVLYPFLILLKEVWTVLWNQLSEIRQVLQK